MFDANVISLVSELANSPIEKFDAILRSKTIWFGRVINYLQSNKGVDVHSTIYKIQDLMEKDPSVLKQPAFIRDAICLTNKLHTYVFTLFESNPNSKHKELLSCIFSLEGCILTRISGDQTKNLEVIQIIKSRLVPENVIYYLSGTSFSQNTTLATACCSYIEENRAIGIRKLQEYLIEKPEKMNYLLNAGCLAKNDFIVKTVWKIICLSGNFAVFKEADKQITSALDYLVNKKEFSDQTLLVGNSQDPQEILIHREVLAQRSAYFNELFQVGFLEGSQSTIVLKEMEVFGKFEKVDSQKLEKIDYDYEEFESIDYQEGFLCFLRYIYTGKADVPARLCLIVNHLADTYFESELKEICEQKRPKKLP